MSKSAGRCQSCHCFTRNCPAGLPNHKNYTAGPSCMMNSLGRHYRDQTDTSNPTCDYESCDFFPTGHEHSKLDYPTDVTIGPAVTESSPSDLSTILQLLQQQKIDADQQKEQLQSLQNQVTNLSLQNVPATTSAPIPSAPPLPTFTSASTAPQVVASAAASLSSHLQSGLGHNHNFGYSGLTMDQLRNNPAVVSDANRLLATSTHNVPPLNPLAGMGQALGTLNGGHNQVNSVDQLYAATTVNKQLKAHEFAATGMFPYKSQLKGDNINAVCFAYGSFKHLEAIKSGLITNISDTEFLARLKHLKNVFEVACLSSYLTCFTDPSWQIAREYDARVIADIEAGAKSWDTLAKGLETDSIYCAKETVELKNKAKKPLREPKDTKKPKDPKDSKKIGCTTYNTHRASDGCFWEHNNKGETCVFEHFCSWCKANRNVTEKHKSMNCEHKPE